MSDQNNFYSELSVLIKRRDVAFYPALIDLINFYSNEQDEFAETLVGIMERAKVRLMIAAEKSSSSTQTKTAEAATQVMAKEDMAKSTPKGINGRF